MKSTPFTKYHESLGAKMAEFAGYNMPIVYSSINEEHQLIREKVGVFDVSHMGEFIIKGPGAQDLVQKISSNDISKLTEGMAQYSCMPNGKGGIVDDLLVYALNDGNYMLVVNASNIEKDWNWIKSNNEMGAEMYNISDQTALLAVQGPMAADALQSLTDIDLKSIKYYHYAKGVFAGVKNVLISATGYTGSGGFELYFEKENADIIWNAIFEAGKEYGIAPAGLAARDTLRLEMGYCLYGNDIDDTTSPIEAGLGWITKLTDNNNFVGRDLIEKEKKEGIQRKLVGFEMIEKGIPRHGYTIMNQEKTLIGEVTSGTQSPSLKKAIGMGYVSKDMAVEGNEIFIDIRNKPVKAKIVKLPFYKS